VLLPTATLWNRKRQPHLTYFSAVFGIEQRYDTSPSNRTDNSCQKMCSSFPFPYPYTLPYSPTVSSHIQFDWWLPSSVYFYHLLDFFCRFSRCAAFRSRTSWFLFSFLQITQRKTTESTQANELRAPTYRCHTRFKHLRKLSQKLSTKVPISVSCPF